MGLLDFRHLLIVTAAVLLLPSAAPDIASDRAALLALRSAVGGRVLLWNLSSPTPCSWAGVTCSGSSSVVELRLPGMGLSGQLPPNTISNLTNLQTLSLRYNALSGPLPADLFSSLISLRNLYLQHNSFSGQIPDSLFSLTNLVRLNLAHNNFSGPLSPSFNNLTRLGTLYLQDNHFSGPIPDLNFPSLVQFNVSNNNLTGQIPKGLSGNPKNSFTGNSLCGAPLDSCGNEKTKKKLSGGAIAGIIIGCVLGFFLILLLLFCLCRVLARKGMRSKDETGANVRELGLPREKTVESGDGTSSSFGAGAESNVISGGKRGLVFLGKMGWNFDMEDLLRASAEVLGKGTFGTTYKAVLETGLAVAVKRLRDVNLGEKELRERVEEIGRMNHENLVPLRAYHCNREEKLLVYDYLPMGACLLYYMFLHQKYPMTRQKQWSGRTPLNWETRATIALGAARGITYLHSQGSSVSHGNIKSSNILLTRSYEARVSDFGLARLAGPAATPTRVAGYQAPEVTDPHKVSQKADVYSFGVLLLEMLTDEWTSEVFDLELLRYQNVEEDMVQLLQLAVDCTEQYPDKRPSMADVTTKIEELCRRSVEDRSGEIIDVGLGSPAT
ncbi:UNVERIFIED_CONTAM: putative inactive receptor kinase [Sesamum radiatum]|uniref:Inactive receptor kinase n=1 Tax=Sesamum radiatum TaxID=300843 RepID=A0AAW2VLR0_SESRA